MNNNFKYKHIIWDWNGTLIDDRSLCLEIINKMLSKRNLPIISKQKYLDNFEFPVSNFYSKIGFKFTENSFHHLASEYLEEYNARFFECPLQINTKLILEFFKNKNISQSVLSASEINILKYSIQKYELEHYFSNILGINNNIAKGKIDLGLKLIKSLDIKAKNVLLIGDTLHDYVVSKKLGTDCLIIANGHNSINKFSNIDVKVISNISTLLDNITVLH